MSNSPISGPMASFSPRAKTSVGRALGLTIALAVALLAALILWAVYTPISGAVIAQGQTVVQGKARDVQHLDGGIVTAINVKNGQEVKEGDVLLQLDPALLQVNIDIARTRLAEALSKQARLLAEQAGEAQIDVVRLKALPELQHLADHDIDGPIAGQQRIMQARAEVLEGQREQLAEKKRQFDNQITGLDGLIASKEEQLGYYDRDISNMEKLAKNGLAREGELLESKGERAALLGQLASYRSERAGIANAVRDAEIEAAQEERHFHEEVVTDLGDVTTTIGELVIQIVTTQKQLDRVEMRAPVTGVVHEMKVSTLGGVIAPGQTVLQIVPSNEATEFELQLPATSIDSVHNGQAARLRLPALDPRRTPELHGQVSQISPTSIMDQATGQSFYRIEVSVSPEELARLEGEKLLPGMPVEAYLETGLRSALDYLLQPMAAHMNRAFRER